jgi:serine/threonine protein kinase
VLREARSAAALNHPNICTIHEVGDADGSAFIAMEYVEGELLSERIGRGPLPIADVVRFGAQAADALAFAHAHSVVHRDLKAANIIVSPAGRLKGCPRGRSARPSAWISCCSGFRAVAARERALSADSANHKPRPPVW